MNIILFYEHYEREYLFLKYLKTKLQINGYRVFIIHFYCEYFVINLIKPKLVVVPFFYSNKDLNCCKVVKKKIKIINLAWEQILYPLKESFKIPSGMSLDKNVLHIAWGKEYKRRLLKYGGNANYIYNFGNYNIFLLNKIQNKKYFIKNILAKKYNLNFKKEWILIPENFSWALMHPAKLKKFLLNNPAEAKSSITSSEKAFLSLIYNLNDINNSFFDKYEIIFRPRPSTTMKQLNNFFFKNSIELSPHIKIIKENSLLFWGISSDIIISTLSTSIIDFSLFNNKVFLLNNEYIPYGLRYKWLKYIPKINSLNSLFDKKNNFIMQSDQSGIFQWIAKEMPGRNSGNLIFKLILNKLPLNKQKSNFKYTHNFILLLLYINYFVYKIFGPLLTRINFRSINYFSDLKEIAKRAK